MKDKHWDFLVLIFFIAIIVALNVVSIMYLAGVLKGDYDGLNNTYHWHLTGADADY